MTSFKSLSPWAALLATLTALGCASSPKAPQPGVPASVPAAPASTLAAPEPEPQTLAEAEALLEQARAELDGLAPGGAGAASPAADAAPPPPSAPPAPARQEKRRAEAEAQAESKAEPEGKAESHCQSACRAFSSLVRASDAVCRLDADGGKRCERARKIRDDASGRVAECGCLQ